MKHSMMLNDEPYNNIYSGSKDIEMRLYDDKRRKIKVGDIITFTNRSTLCSFDVRVVKLHVYRSFEGLYVFFDKERLGYKKEEIASSEDMKKYYSDEDIRKYGVVGIEIEKIST